MDIIVIFTVIALSYIVLSLVKHDNALAIFFIVTLYLGLVIFQEGITFDTRTITTTGTTLNYLMFVIMTLGSLMGAYSALTKGKG